jgi:hypothetical protein
MVSIPFLLVFFTIQLNSEMNRNDGMRDFLHLTILFSQRRDGLIYSMNGCTYYNINKISNEYILQILQ